MNLTRGRGDVFHASAYQLSTEVDYRTIFIEEEIFLEHFYDVYQYATSISRIPSFERVFQEMIDYNCYFYFINNRQEFPEISERDEEVFKERLLDSSEQELLHVYSKMSDDFVELYARDLHLFMHSEGYVFIEDSISRRSSHVHNPPFDTIW